MNTLDDIYNEKINTIVEEDEELVDIPEEISTEKTVGEGFSDAIEDSIIEEITETTDTNEDTTKPYDVVMVKATSRVATQLKDVWYSFEFTETRKVNDDTNIEELRQNLWDTVNVEVDKQVQDVIYMLKSGS